MNITIGVDKVEWKLQCMPETEPIRGNLCDSGDARLDKEQEDQILKAIDDGNDWAWCWIRVTGEWHGLKAEACISCCSYESEAQFKELGGYGELQHEVLRELEDAALAIAKEVMRPVFDGVKDATEALQGLTARMNSLLG